MAVYCNKCGSANPEGSDFCSRCGAGVMPAPAGELILPDWLAQAAREAPNAAPAHARFAPFEAANHESPTSRPSIPNGDLSTSMPSWLKGPMHVESPAHGQESLLTDPTDTRSFITEDDLPDWIRQIAIEEDAKLAEQANKAAAAVSEPAPADQPVEAQAPSRRRLLPGEIDSVRTAASPWLARGDRPAVEAQTPSVSHSSAVAEAADAVPVRVEPSINDASGTRKLQLPSRGALTLRHALVAAIVVLILAVILVAVLL